MNEVAVISKPSGLSGPPPNDSIVCYEQDFERRFHLKINSKIYGKLKKIAKKKSCRIGDVIDEIFLTLEDVVSYYDLNSEEVMNLDSSDKLDLDVCVTLNQKVINTITYLHFRLKTFSKAIVLRSILKLYFNNCGASRKGFRKWWKRQDKRRSSLQERIVDVGEGDSIYQEVSFRFDRSKRHVYKEPHRIIYLDFLSDIIKIRLKK